MCVCVYTRARAHHGWGLGRCPARHLPGRGAAGPLPAPQPSLVSRAPLSGAAGCGSETGMGWTRTAPVGEGFPLPVGGFPGKGCGEPEGAAVGQERQRPERNLARASGISGPRSQTQWHLRERMKRNGAPVGRSGGYPILVRGGIEEHPHFSLKLGELHLTIQLKGNWMGTGAKAEPKFCRSKKRRDADYPFPSAAPHHCSCPPLLCPVTGSVRLRGLLLPRDAEGFGGRPRAGWPRAGCGNVVRGPQSAWEAMSIRLSVPQSQPPAAGC